MPLFCWFDHFLYSRAEICQIFRWLFVKFKISKRHSEINSPLQRSLILFYESTKKYITKTQRCWDVDKELKLSRCFDSKYPIKWIFKFMNSTNHHIVRRIKRPNQNVLKSPFRYLCEKWIEIKRIYCKYHNALTQ